MDNIKELITELKQNIETCKMDIAGGNELNVLDALDSVAEIEQLIILRVSQHRELLEAYTKQIKEDNEFTEEITFQDINKCIASNCG